MSAPVVSVSGLLASLDAVGARLTLDGDGLALSGKRPPAALVDAVKARRAEVLAYLQGEGITEAEKGGEVVQNGDNLPPSRRTAPSLPDWAALSAQPGHCGSCGRSADAPDWGALMVTCTCPPSAFEAGVKPLALHVGHRCAAYAGRGWKGSGGVDAPTGVGC